ncbi:hypothetical protein [Bacillus gaemokensis]|uniref:Uncharacterized protein n=1 Tax=Bacillus gaemokensis TaxID=574375 RepID=A0A073KBS5_9BACI|nr:hypothetical protein [Bacillus gaemokensis]KEK24010.1 hypothetical protein BAGA_04670 [Bacillus gaemokensis]KYG27215.1 hypothetical protein AZF08_15825 [Bacillus gaemokensis]
MYLFPLRIAVAAPSVHVSPVHTGSAGVGIELPAIWQQYQLPSEATPSFWHYGTHSGHPYPATSPYAAPQIFYHFPSIYFQNFYGTFNI